MLFLSPIDQISNLKLALERKEAELGHLSGGNVRGAASPLRVPKYHNSATLKPEISGRPIDETRSSEVGRPVNVFPLHCAKVMDSSSYSSCDNVSFRFEAVLRVSRGLVFPLSSQTKTLCRKCPF